MRYFLPVGSLGIGREMITAHVVIETDDQAGAIARGFTPIDEASGRVLHAHRSQHADETRGLRLLQQFARGFVLTVLTGAAQTLVRQIRRIHAVHRDAQSANSA